MKRLFILASAAIVALAACTKTEVVYKEAPQEIGFNAVSGVMTKSSVALKESTMGVFAHRDGALYFDNTSFKDYTTHWGVSNVAQTRYWPVSGTLTFTAYAPYDDTNVTFTENTLKINADNRVLASQKDWHYGTTRPVSAKTDENVDVTLNHALSLVEINIAKNTNVYLLGVELLNTNQKGVCSIIYPTAIPSWELDATSPTASTMALYEPDNSETGDKLSADEKCTCLVIPTETLNAEAIRLTYKLEGSSSVLTYTTDGTTYDLTGAWAYGKKYVYNITIGTSEIKFNPTVTDWTEVTPNTAVSI